MSNYLDVIRSLPEGGGIPAPTAGGMGGYTDVIKDMDLLTGKVADGNVFAAQDSKPDDAGQAEEIGKQLGVPASVVESDLPGFTKQYHTARAQAAMRDNPALAVWASKDGQAVRAANDDFDKLDVVSKAITAAKAGFSQGQLQDQLARVGYAELKGGKEADLYRVTDAERQLREALSRPDGVDGPMYNAIKTVSGFLGGLTSQAERPLWMAVGGAAVGTALPVVGTAAGGAAGFIAGMVREGFETGSGQLYNSLKNEKDKNGNPMDPDVARGVSLVGGLGLGLLNAMSLEKMGQPFGDVMRSVIPALAKKMVERPTLAAAAKNFATGAVKSAVTGAVFGAMAETISVTAENVAKSIDAGDYDTIFGSEAERSKAIDRIVQSAEDMALTFSVLHLPARGLGLTADLVRAREASNRKLFVDALADGSAQSKLRERSPSAFERFIAGQTEGTPVENLYVPVEQVMKLYQDAGVDPTRPETDHLFPFVKDMGRQIEQAGPIGGDVVIKTSDYATHVAGTDVDAKLRDHIKVGPDAMSMEEAKTFFQDYKKDLEAQAKGMKAEIEKPEESDDKIRTEVAKQLEEAGYKPRTAGGMAAQMAAFFRTIGKRVGVDPYELFRKYGLKVGREKEIPKGAVEQAMFHGTTEDVVQSIAREGLNPAGVGNAKHLYTSEAYEGREGYVYLSREAGDAAGWAWSDRAGAGGKVILRTDIDPKVLKRDEADDTGTGAMFKGNIPPEKLEISRDGGTTWKPLTEEIDKKWTGVPDRDKLEAASAAAPPYGEIKYQEKRGYITFGGRDRKMKIGLLEKADLSTFLHESGHMYLEVLRDLKDAPEMKEDIDAIHKYLGVDSWKDVKTEHHEKFARSFEAYLMEGKAPSPELRGAFARFRSWLMTIYKQIGALGVNLTPEVRNVFDRMFASQDEIAAARRGERLEALFTDAKQAGMSDAEFTAYKRSLRRAAEGADERLFKKVMETVRKSRTREWKAREAEVRKEVVDQVDKIPEIQAAQLLESGEVKLDRTAVEAMYPSDHDLSHDLPGKMRLVKGGMHPDEVAERVGLPSGDALMKKLFWLRKEQDRAGYPDRVAIESLRGSRVEGEVANRMAAEHGDILADGSIRDEALAAVHSTQQAEILAAELRALGRTLKRPPTPYQVARQWAKGQIAGKKIMDGTKDYRYARDEAKAARGAEKALLAGDHKEAYRQKQLQLLNHVLYMESRAAKEEVDSGAAAMSRYARMDRIKGMDPDYLEQIHGLLERFDFRPASEPEKGRRASLRAWVSKQMAEGEEVRVPERYLDEAFKKHYTDLTVEEFRGLTDAVQNIAHLGKLKSTLLDRAERRDMFDVVNEAVAQLADMKARKIPDVRNPGEGGKGLDRVNAKFLRAGVTVRSLDAALLKMEQVFDWLDKQDPNGVFNRIVFRRISEAQNKENTLRIQIGKRLRALSDAMPKEMRDDLLNRYEVELPDSKTGKPSQMLKSEIIAMALNTGNLSNFDKLLRGEGWTESAVQGVLERHMTKADWTFVQGVWDSLESLWPDIADMEKRLSGAAPEKVENRPFQNKHGKFSGGYYPMIYDPLRSFDVELNRQRASDQLFENNYQRATTPHGYTVERVQPYARPLYLSLEVLPRHIAQVTHDLAYREAVMDADRFLQNPKVRDSVETVLGREVYQQFRPWLQAIANDRVHDERGLAFWDKMAHSARTTATMVGLGFRLTTMMIHGLTAASNSIGEVGPRWMASGMRAFFGTPEKMAAARDFIFDRSGEMAHRMDSIDRDVREGLRDLEGKTGMLTQARRFAYYGISALDMASALPTWMGAYNKALHEGLAEQDAIYAADKSVRNAHGAGSIKDLPAIQRGSEFQKLFTMFYSFWSHFYNRQRDMAHRLRGAGQMLSDGDVKGAAHDFSLVLARSVFYFILPQIIHAALRSKGKEDEDKSFGTLAAEEIGLGFFAGIPVVRDIAHAAFLGKDYEATPAASIVKAFAATAKDLTAATGIRDAEVSDRWLRHAIETAGYTFGLPLGQPAASVQYLWDVMRGDLHPEDLRDWLHGIVYGKQEETR